MRLHDLKARLGPRAVTRIARACGIKPQAVSQWEKVPPRRVPAIADAFDIPRHEFYPDLWPKPAEAA